MVTPLRGTAVIGQSGGPTSVINQSLVGALEAAAERSGVISRFYGALHGVDGILAQRFVDLRRERPAELARISRTPSAALGSVRKKPSASDCEQIFRIFQAHDVRYFFYIGGNDSAETAHIIDTLARDSGYEFRVVHIPKTIDNDLLVTDHSPGYGSAARFVALAFMGDDLDNRALGGVKINVVMGRHAGFLTAAAALGRRRECDGPHLVYLPEANFDVDKFCGDVEDTMSRFGRCVVALSEGISDANGQPIVESGEVDPHGNVQLSGSGALGDFLSQKIKEKVGVQRVRADTFGYLQRSFPAVVSRTDAREAREVGAYAVRAATQRDSLSGSVAIRRLNESEYGVDYFVTDLQNVARKTRQLPDHFLAHSGNHVTQEFVDYASPLVGDLPEMGFLSGAMVRAKDIEGVGLAS